MNTIDAILERRTRRDFKDEPLEKEAIFTILKAGMNAPSGMNVQPWHFSVITDKKLLEKLENAIIEVKSKTIESAPFPLRNAPMCVVISAEDDAFTPLVDTGCAAQNMLLAATDLGLGSGWCNAAHLLNGDAEMREFLKIPDGYSIVTSLLFGSSDEKPTAPMRRGGTVEFITEE